MDMKNGEDWRKKVKRERNKQTEREGTKELGLITLSVETSFHIFMTPQSRFSKKILLQAAIAKLPATIVHSLRS